MWRLFIINRITFIQYLARNAETAGSANLYLSLVGIWKSCLIWHQRISWHQIDNAFSPVFKNWVCAAFLGSQFAPVAQDPQVSSMLWGNYPKRTGRCFRCRRVWNFAHVLKSRICRRELEGWTPSNSHTACVEFPACGTLLKSEICTADGHLVNFENS